MEDAKYAMQKRQPRSVSSAKRRYAPDAFGPSWAYARPAGTADLERSCKGAKICSGCERLLKESLKECGAFKTGEFTLTSGKKSNFYVDIKQASTNPKILKEIAGGMADLLEGEDKIAGMELGAVPLAVALSLECSLPYLIIRKKDRVHGTGKLIEGDMKFGDKILLVEDVTTTGSSVVKAADIIRNEGGVVDRVIVVVDREEGASELLKEHNITLVPLVKVGEML